MTTPAGPGSPRRPAARLLVPVVVALALVGAAGTAPVASAAPAAPAAPVAAAAGCPGQEVPPGPPAREETVPVAPLPVPSPPVGGLGGCGDTHAGPVPPPPVGVASYVVADLDSGAVLAARAPHARQRPASTIKLLLALVVDERLPMDRVVVGTAEDANVDGSRAGIGPGGRYTVDQLLHGLLLSSGNDAANALARELGGVPATLAAMRDEARRLGALDTRPATPAGLDGPGMSASAYDLGLLLRAALERPRIAAALTTRSIPFPGFADKPGFLLGNDDRLLGAPGFLGGKNGFTDAARHTFVGAMERDGRRLVVAIVRGEPRPVLMVDQARALLDWGFGAQATGIGTLVEPGTTGSADGSDTPPGAAAPAGGAGGADNAGGAAASGDADGATGSTDGATATGTPDAAGAPPVPAAVLVGGVAALAGVGALVAARLRRRR
ncbi:D-alanyl-D-alanine carboxypeptidase family protein [Pseudonocardia sp. ICBG601]|uniref:D-alanyl-D-alanine carboxypeptidase family protein n=1 Tax=Pseudonocardia sp. ICBG601 TaxID=2846759 RepID=UPI001CF6A4F8|nr:serine hydrolase [Pseudonocardia sp. ICBG601]